MLGLGFRVQGVGGLLDSVEQPCPGDIVIHDNIILCTVHVDL